MLRFSLPIYLAGTLWTGCAGLPEVGWEAEVERQLRDRGACFDLGWIEPSPGIVPVSDRPLATEDEVLFGILLEDGAAAKVWHVRMSVASIESRGYMEFLGQWPFQKRLVAPGSPAARRGGIVPGLHPSTGHSVGFIDEPLAKTAMAQIEVAAFDTAGRALGVGTSSVPVFRLARGFLPAAEAGYRYRDVMRGRIDLGTAAPMLELNAEQNSAIEVVADGMISCNRFFHIVQKNPIMRQILWEVLALPSLWSMVSNFGVKAAISVDFFAARRLPSDRFPRAGRELWSVPMTVLLNDQPALLARLVFGPSGGPDGAAAGVFGILARHPTRPDRRVWVQLLATRSSYGR